MAVQSILLTRPAAASARFARALHEALGDQIRVIVSPLMAPSFLAPDLPAGPFAALVLTSETGAEAARRISAEGHILPPVAYCVGDQTARAATEAGFATRSAKGDAEALLALIHQDPPGGPLLYLHGRDTRGDLGTRLRNSGIKTHSAVVYDQNPCPLSPEARQILSADNPVLLPLFSPRSASLFLAAGQGTAPLWVAALSPSVAEVAARLAPARLQVAPRPEAESLLETVRVLMQPGWRT